MNGTEKIEGPGFHKHLKPTDTGYNQKRSETQLQTDRVAGHLPPKALGFTRFLVNGVCLKPTLFFYDLDGFGRIRSTQPTQDGRFFSKFIGRAKLAEKYRMF